MHSLDSVVPAAAVAIKAEAETPTPVDEHPPSPAEARKKVGRRLFRAHDSGRCRCFHDPDVD